MPRTLLAASALACVCSPAMAGTLGLGDSSVLYHYASSASLILAMAFGVIVVAAHLLKRVPPPDAKIWLIPLAFMMTMMFGPAMAGAGPVAEGLPAAGFAHGLAFELLLFGALALTGAVCIAGRARLPVLGILVAALIACAVGPALAAEVATADTTSITLSAAPWISLIQEIVITAVIPAVAAYAIQAIRKVYPWAALFLTQARVEQMANAVTEYAINAVPGAVKEGKLSINVGSQVIAKAVQRAVDAAPAKALEAAGGEAGLAEIVFRKLNLEDGANEHNTLAPVVASLPRSGR